VNLPGRFDNAFMRPPVPRGPVDTALLDGLRAWCEAGAYPRMIEPLSVASMSPHAGLDAAACALDGSFALARLSRWRGWAWRAQIVLRDHLSRRDPHPGDPWDCGWWREGPIAAASAFRPRRATLLLVAEPSRTVTDALLATLRAGSATYSRPLRVLLVSASPAAGVPRI
jgi:hypothetical protein